MGRPKTIFKTKLRSFINFMAREIFNASVKNLKDKRLIFDFNFKNEIIRLNISIDYDAIVGGIYTEGFDIWGSSSDEDIQMYVRIYSHNFKNTSYNEFNAYIREFLRHELEHIAQYLDINGKPNIYDSEPTSLIEEYLIQPHEIDAFLYGLNYKRKYLKTNIKDEIQSLLMRYYRLTDNNIADKIEKVWYKRLKEILPHLVD
jgi:hypothetical protein